MMYKLTFLYKQSLKEGWTKYQKIVDVLPKNQTDIELARYCMKVHNFSAGYFSQFKVKEL